MQAKQQAADQAAQGADMTTKTMLSTKQWHLIDFAIAVLLGTIAVLVFDVCRRLSLF